MANSNISVFQEANNKLEQERQARKESGKKVQPEWKITKLTDDLDQQRSKLFVKFMNLKEYPRLTITLNPNNDSPWSRGTRRVGQPRLDRVEQNIDEI